MKNSTDEKNELRAAYLAYRAEWRRTHKESIRRSNQKYYQKTKKGYAEGWLRQWKQSMMRLFSRLKMYPA